MRWQAPSGKPPPRSGDMMPQWVVRDEHIKCLRGLTDDLEKDLMEIDGNIMGIHLDQMVRDYRNKSRGPCSVDAICYCNDTVYLIEFKAEKGGECREEIVARYPNKAMDSLAILYRFLGCDKSDKVNLIIVHQNVRQELAGNLAGRSMEFGLPEEISWLGMRDSKKQGIFFDKVEYKSCKDFVISANKHLTSSTKEMLESKFRPVPYKE